MMKKKKLKSQVSMEFVIVIGIVFVIFLVILAFSIERKNEVAETENYLNAVSECEKFSNLITGAYSGGDGTVFEAYTSYIINFLNSSQIEIKNAETGNTEVSCNAYGMNSYFQARGRFIIKNENGIVAFKNITI